MSPVYMSARESMSFMLKRQAICKLSAFFKPMFLRRQVESNSWPPSNRFGRLIDD
uniref:Uncharacterized protein n=1 Tax=Arundo donax TaxID=35708 RepID=A0A0A9E3Y0_ARUDO